MRRVQVPLREEIRGCQCEHRLVYRVEDALAADGWGVESTPGSLARWGYELYGGFILSGTSLREVTDFQGWFGLGVMDLSGE
jgi:hypothetical protein